MLFLVIEHFKNDDAQPVRERFVRAGRRMPEGVVYHGSWIDPATTRCFQIMEAENAGLLRVWTANWEDLVEFEIIPVLSSKEYWEKFGQPT